MIVYDAKLGSRIKIADALQVWMGSAEFREFASHGNIEIRSAKDPTSAYDSTRAERQASGTVVFLSSADISVLTNPSLNDYKVEGAIVAHELAHLIKKGGYPLDPSYSRSPNDNSQSIAAEAIAYTAEAIVARQLGANMSQRPDTNILNKINQYQTSSGSSDDALYGASYSLIGSDVRQLPATRDANYNLLLNYDQYTSLGTALSLAGVAQPIGGLVQIDYSKLNEYNVVTTDTGPSSWTLSAHVPVLSGGYVDVMGSVTGLSSSFTQFGYDNAGKFFELTYHPEENSGVPKLTGLAQSATPTVTAYGPVSPEGNFAVELDKLRVATLNLNPSSFSFGYVSLAQTFGSSLGRLIGGSSLIIGTAAGSVISATALSIGQQLFHVSYYPDATVAGFSTMTSGVFQDFGNNLSQFGQNAAIGSVSSYLAAEFAQSVGLNGVAGDVFSDVTGNVLSYIVTHPVDKLLAAGGLHELGNVLETGLAAFVGQELASLVVTPHTVAESTLASLGSAVGAYFGAKAAIVGAGLAGPPGAAIGAFIGFILGDLIGSLFGHHKPRPQMAMAEAVLQIPFARYGVGGETSANGGDLAFADSMAKAARDTLNGIIAQITHGAMPSFVSNTSSPTQTYGYTGSQIYVKYAGQQHNVTSADQAVDQGVLWALPQTQIIGGDIFLKRAIANGQEPSITALLGDLQIASDYETYLKDEPVIDASIASSWNSLSPQDKDFYSQNQAFMTRAISMTELPLTGNDVGFYNANQMQVDRIIGSISVSTFAAGWIATLARAAELKLGDFAASDFNGGLQGFLQSFGVASKESAVHYEDASLSFANGNLAINLTGSAAAGTFSLLPQGSNDGRSVAINNFAGVMGYTTGSTSAVTNASDLVMSTTPITLGNYSFENPVLADGAGAGGVTGWAYQGDVGVFNPNNGLIAPTDGDNVLFMNGPAGYAAVSQPAGAFVAGVTYTLTFDVGARLDASPNLGYVQSGIFSTDSPGGIAPTYNLTATLGSMQTYAISYTATSADAGHPILLYLGINYAPSQVNFDNVRLSEVSSSPMTVAAGDYGYDFGEYGSLPASNDGDDIILGGNGNDLLSAGIGSVWVDGGAGNDVIYGGAGRDVLLGGDGGDIIVGGSGASYLAGGSGNDSLYGGAGDDTIVGGDGVDAMLGYDGDDTFIVDPDGGGTFDYMDGGAGSDTVSFERLTAGITIDMRANAPPLSATAFLGDRGVYDPIYSPDHAYFLQYQGDGNLVLYGPSGPVWATFTSGAPGHLSMQPDGNLVVYNQAGNALWASNTVSPGAKLYLQNTGRLSIDDSNGHDLWSISSATVGVANGAAAPLAPILAAGTYMTVGQTRTSADTRSVLVYQGDGNLVLMGPSGDVIWASGTANSSTGYVYMQTDGNLCIINGSGVPIFYSGTQGNNGAGLYLNDAGHLSIIDVNGQERWWAALPSGNGFTSRNYGDAWVSIENVTGTNYNDVLIGLDTGSTLRGLAGDDTLKGGVGNDVLEGGAGADQIDGGPGINTASYASSTAGVYVNLTTGTTIGGDATGDVLTNIYSLIGSAFGDELMGTAGFNRIDAGAGDDWIDVSEGADIYSAGEGFDTIDYSQGAFLAGGGTPALAIDLSQGTGTYRKSDGSVVTQGLHDEEQIIGTSSNDMFSGANTSYNMTWDGNGGNDTYSGGSGSDIYVFGADYGSNDVYDNNQASNVIRLKSGIIADDIFVANIYGTLVVKTVPSNGYVNVYGNFGGGNNIIKTIDFAGAAPIDITQIDGGLNFTSGDDDIHSSTYGASNLSAVITGYAGNDVINTDKSQGNLKGDVIIGGQGNDISYTSNGDDQFVFERGDGHDTVYDTGGNNMIIFGPTVAADDVIYKVSGIDLYVGVKDLNNPTLDASQVVDNLLLVGAGALYTNPDGSTVRDTAFSVMAGGVTTDLTKANIAWTTLVNNGSHGGPVVLDLDDDGLELSSVVGSDIVTKAANGDVARTSWVGPTNGILAFDRNGDGSINNTGDISFVNDKAGATTDLEGLAGWDTNGDNVLNSSDANWSKLEVWTDRNQDARAEASEVATLDQLGITSIALKLTPTGYDGSDTRDSFVQNTTTFTRADGTSGTGYDVALASQSLASAVDPRAATTEIDAVTQPADETPATFGQLKNDVTAAAKAMGIQSSALTAKQASALAVVDMSSEGGAISDADAERWATYLDPTKNAARRVLEQQFKAGTLAGINATDVPVTGGRTSINPFSGRGLSAPAARLQAIVVQIDDKAPTLVDPESSSTFADVAHTGVAGQIGWVGATSGILALDRNGDGSIDPATEIDFRSDVSNAKTALQGLAAFDTNHDGVLSTADASFASFLIWRDKNGNGVSDRGELQSLAKVGVSEIALDASGVSPDRGDRTSNEVLGKTSATFSTGESHAAYDVALGFASNTGQTPAAASPTASPDALTTSSVSTGSVATSGAASQTPKSASAAMLPSAETNATGASTVTSSRSAGDGPTGDTVQSSYVDGANADAWWRTGGASSLSAGASSLYAPQTTATGDQQAPAVYTQDAAMLQRQQLLRQALASFQANAAGGSVAVWDRQALLDQGTSIAAAQLARTAAIPPASALAA